MEAEVINDGQAGKLPVVVWHLDTEKVIKLDDDI